MNPRPLSLMILVGFFGASQVQADEPMFTGDKKLACEAVMCLSTGKRPDECDPSIQKYLSIHYKKAWKTAAKRKAFLEMCPQGDTQATPEQMDQALKDIGLEAQDDDSAEE